MSSDTERKGLKRKLDQTLPTACNKDATLAGELEPESTTEQVRNSVAIISSALGKPADKVDRMGLRRAAHVLSELSKSEENVDTVIGEGAVDAVVPLLTYFENADLSTPVAPGQSWEEVEKEACFILGLLAIKTDHQNKIANAGALAGLVGLLKRHVPFCSASTGTPGTCAGVARRAADAITNLAHENITIKNKVRDQGGIVPLVSLLESYDTKVARAAAGALRTLAFKNEENKNLIVHEGALPTLIQMLRAEDAGIHYEAVGVIGNLVHSSLHIKRQVLEEGALSPVIKLLSSKCAESQREAALLLGQFATTEPDFKARIVQRGAVPPLIVMLGHNDIQLREMAAFALGRLAQNAVDNQAGIVQQGGLIPLLDLLASKVGNLQHNAAFALYGLADNEDNISDLVREGGVARLMECDLLIQASKDCVQKTIKRLEEKVQGKVLNQILYALTSSDKIMQQRTALALARLCREEDICRVFVDRKGLDVLLELLLDTTKKEGLPSRESAAVALFDLAKKAKATLPIDCAPMMPAQKVYLGEKFVNNQTLSDVTFLVEGRKFFAHRIALLASSDTFRAMFDGHYKEKEASQIPIPNIRFEVFECMMSWIYTGDVRVTEELAEDLLQASDQYMLEGLKRLCESTISGVLTLENLVQIFDMAENFNANQLTKHCVLYTMEHFVEVTKAIHPANFLPLLKRMVPKLKLSLTEELRKSTEEVLPEADE